MHNITPHKFIIEKLGCHLIFYGVLDESPKRTNPIFGIVAVLKQILFCARSKINAQPMLLQTSTELTHLQIDNLKDVLFSKATEHHNLINAVQKLWAELFLEPIEHVAFVLFVHEIQVIKIIWSFRLKT